MEQKMVMLLSERAFPMRYIQPSVRSERVPRILDVGIDRLDNSA